VLSACRLDKDLEKLEVDTPAVALPLITSRIGVQDVLDRFEHDSLVATGSDGFVTLVYEGSVFSRNGSDILQIPTPSITVPNVSIPDMPVAISLGEMANNIGDPEKTTIISAHGTTSLFPSVPAQPGGTFDIGATGGSTYAFESGTMDLTIQNDWPVDLTNVAITIYDSVSASNLATYNYPVIPAGQSRTRSSSVAGKTFSANMSVSVTNVSSPGNITPVAIDTSDLLQFIMEGVDLVFEVARDTVSLNFNNEERIDKIIFGGGSLDYTGTASGGLANANLQFVFPNLTAGGPVPGIPLNGTSSIDFTGYEFDFTGGSLPKNSFAVIVKIDGTGATIPFSTAQTVTPSITFGGLSLSYAEGYLGKQSFNLQSDTISISVYKNWEAGAVSFTDPSLTVNVDNSFGFPINLKFNTFEAYSTQSGNTVSVVTPFDSLDFNYPTVANVGTSESTNVRIDKGNSNIVTILDTPPNQVTFDLDVSSNKAGDTTATNFITDSSFFDVGVLVELPMEATISNLIIQDTMEIKTGFLDAARYMNFSVVSENNFPLDVELQVYFTKNSGKILDSLMVTPVTLLKSGNVDGNGQVIAPRKHVTYIAYGEERMDNMREARKAIVRVKFQSTGGGATPVKIFTSSYFDLKIGVETTLNTTGGDDE
jgi:hypothetical protein